MDVVYSYFDTHTDLMFNRLIDTKPQPDGSVVYRVMALTTNPWSTAAMVLDMQVLPGNVLGKITIP